MLLQHIGVRLKKDLMHISVFFVLGLVLFLLLPYTCYASDGGIRQVGNKVEVPITLWNQLKTEQNEQRIELANQKILLEQLEEALKRVKSPSEQLLRELTIAKSLVKTSEEKLTYANSSLEDAKKSIQAARTEITELRTSLTKLKDSIDRERAIAKRKRVQSSITGFLLGIISGIVIAR